MIVLSNKFSENPTLTLLKHMLENTYLKLTQMSNLPGDEILRIDTNCDYKMPLSKG